MGYPRPTGFHWVLMGFWVGWLSLKSTLTREVKIVGIRAVVLYPSVRDGGRENKNKSLKDGVEDQMG